eukprot:CAMPEP_0119370162 /NCGR_PEP_ID=MMETSP1334-20130426/16574_1 /TAXON_ID=127549 /ORGANISM="Calcidiscus leptoporus, Strain RCC1130" /LENGTH=52 /DNA_ID=CAMNT_0007387171 /DNA_START=86 /DNA_END=244 /DNA_ORIENTATION=+
MPIRKREHVHPGTAEHTANRATHAAGSRASHWSANNAGLARSSHDVATSTTH